MTLTYCSLSGTLHVQGFIVIVHFIFHVTAAISAITKLSCLQSLM